MVKARKENDYDSVINVHIWRNRAPDRAGGDVPGMLAAYENQAQLDKKRFRSNAGW